MVNFKVGFLQDILSCEMKNFDGPIWFLRDISVGPIKKPNKNIVPALMRRHH